MQQFLKISAVSLIGGVFSVAVYASDFTPTYGPYIGVHGGVAVPGGDNSTLLDVGPDVGIQVGYQLGGFRLEAAGTYLSHELVYTNSVALRLLTLMANGYYDFNVSGVVSPFVGAGVGWLNAQANAQGSRLNLPDANEFAYQGIAGLRFHAMTHFAIDVDYHRLGWTDGNLADNLFEVGLNYVF